MTWLTSANVPYWLKMNHGFIDNVNEFLDRLNPAGVTVTSSYRTPAENQRVGGVFNSKHLTGEAIDLVLSGVNPVYVPAAKKNLPIKVIYYPVKNYYHVQVGASTWFDIGLIPEGSGVGVLEISVVAIVGIMWLLFLSKK